MTPEQYQELMQLRKEARIFRATLQEIARRAQSWDSNQLGNVSHQRQRWQALGLMAEEALKDAKEE